MTIDVAIAGGGYAGLTLALQLRRQAPDLAVAVYERAEAPSHKVGESTVEIASDYLVRRLGLGTYLYDAHLPKNGLRFFFDNEDHNLPLAEMTEIGSDALPHWPSFQLDRARLERDLIARARAAGVEVHEGTTVAVEPQDTGVAIELSGATSGRIRPRFFVDGTGRRRLLGRALGRQAHDVNHHVRAAWGRVTGVRDIDALGDEAWRSRVKHTARSLSTNHFCCDGYWIWFIPLREGLTSVGVVGEPGVVPRGMHHAEPWLAFLRGHGGAAELLPDGVDVRDTMAFERIAYGYGDDYLGPTGTAMIGEAAAFADPFYSPGGDFVAIGNDLVADLIVRELRGDPDAAERRALYDQFLRARYDAAMELYRDQYRHLGSSTLLELRWRLDIGSYYNLWFDAYRRDLHLDPQWLDEQVRMAPFIVGALRQFARLFDDVATHLDATGQRYAGNAGRFLHGLRDMPWVQDVGEPRSRKAVLRRTGEIFNAVHGDAMEALGEVRPGPKPLFEFLTAG